MLQLAQSSQVLPHGLGLGIGCREGRAVTSQACKARFSGKAPASTALPVRPAARVVVVRAEEGGKEGGKVTTVRRPAARRVHRHWHGSPGLLTGVMWAQTERKANNPGPAPLLFASEQSLSYLDGTRPADYGCGCALAPACRAMAGARALPAPPARS